MIDQSAKTRDGRSGLVRLHLVLVVAGLVPGKALALPEGLVVQGGVIGVSQPDAATLLIQQGTDRAAGDWRSFNIGAGERVTIQQPSATSLMLARVIGGVGTEIFGQLNANGGLLLLNPHGVLIGPGASINTASFAAGTLNADPARFMQGGPVQLERLPGAPADAAVINRGSISVADAGLVALISPQVINQGLITARLGTIELATGTTATLDLNGGTGLYQVALDPAVSAALLSQGQIDGQFVRIGAGEAQALLHSAVNLDGLVLARGADGRGGTIEVRTGGDLQVNGRLDASGDAGASGGTIKLLANRVALLEQARVDASGGTGGGEILIGGNYLGRGPEPNATVAVLTRGAEVTADARTQGDGGRVILWSDAYTGFYGRITARGGAQGGNGGFVETSSKDNLQARGRVDASASQGQGGHWLIDPTSITILGTATTSITSTSPAAGQELWTPDPGATGAVIDSTDLLTQLDAGTNVTITTASTGTDPGNIDFDADLNGSNTSSKLTLVADGKISFNANTISLPGVNLEITKASGVVYQAGFGSTFASVKQTGVTGTTSFLTSLKSTAAAGIVIDSKMLDIQSTVIASVGPMTLTAGTGGIEVLRVGGVTNLTATTGALTLDSAAKILIASNNAANSGAPSMTAGTNLTLKSANGIQLNGLTTLTSTAGSIAIDGTFDGYTPAVLTNHPDGLTLSASAGTITTNSSLGATQALNSLGISNSAGATFAGTVSLTATGPAGSTGLLTITKSAAASLIKFEDNLNVQGLVTSTSTLMGYRLSLLGSTNTFTSAVDLKNTGTITLGNGGDLFTFDGGLAFSGNAPIETNGTIRTSADAINFGTGALTISGATTVDSTNNAAAPSVAGGTITFGGAVNGAGQSLTIRASTMAGTLDATGVNFNGTVNLGTLNVNPGQYKVSFSGATNTFATSLNFQNAGLVTMGVANTNNAFTLNDGVTFTGNPAIKLGGTFNTPGKALHLGTGNPTLIANTTVDTTVSGNTAGANVTFGGIIGGPYGLTINAGTGGAITENNIDGLTSLTILNALKVRVNGYATLDSFTIQNAGAGAANGVVIAGNAKINNFVTGNQPFDLTFSGSTNEFSAAADSKPAIFNNTGKLSLGDSLADTFLFDDGFQLNGAIGVGGPSQLLLGATVRTSGEAIITDRAITLVSDSELDGTGGGGIQIDGTIDATAAGAQSLTLKTKHPTNAPVGAANNVVVNGAIGATTALGALTINSADQLTLGAATTIATKAGAISLTATSGITTSATGATTLASQGGSITINSSYTLNANQVVNSGGGAISFGDAVNGNTRTLTIDGGTGGSASFAGNVSLKGLATAANNYTVSLTGTTNAITDPVAFNNTGVITLGDAAADGFTFTGGLSVAGVASLNLAGTFNTTNTAFSAGTRPVTLNANTSVNSGGGAISFVGVSGVGKTLSLDGGNSSFTGDVTLKNLITAANNYSVSLTGAANTFADQVAFNNTGAITLGDGGDAFTFTAGVAFAGNAALNLGGSFSVTTAGAGFNGGTRPIALASDTSITTNGATISLHSLNAPLRVLTIDPGNGGQASFTGANDLKGLVTAGNAYSISFTGATNVFGDAVAFKNTTGTVTFGSAAGAGSHTFSFTNGFTFPGNANISLGALIRTAGQAMAFGTGSPTLLADSELATTWNSTGAPVNPNSAGANISLGGNLNGPTFGLTIDAGTGGTISENTITLNRLTITKAASVSVSGNTTLSNLVTGTGSHSISFKGATNVFGTNATTGAGSKIEFKNTGALTLGDGGDDFLFNDGVVVQDVSGLTLGGTIRTPGMAVTLSKPTTLNGSGGVTTTANGAPGAAITVTGTINGTTAGVDNVTFNAGNGAISFSDAIGATKAVGSFTAATTGSLTLTSAADIVAGGAVSLTGGAGITSGADITTTKAPITIQSPLTLSADQVLNSGGGAISFLSSVTSDGVTGGTPGGTKTLTIDPGSGGSASFAGDVTLKAFTTQANNYSVSFTGSTNTITDALTFNNAGDLTLGNGGDAFTFTGGVVATLPSAINLGSTLTAAGTGVITLGDNDTALNVTGTTTIGGTSTGAITLGAATLANKATLTVGAGAATPINLATVSGTAGAGNASNLTINSTGAVNVSGAVGTNIGNLTITNSGGITFAANVAVNSLVTTANPYTITFKGANNSFTQAVDFLNSGTVSLGDAAAGTDVFLFDGGLSFTGNAAINLKGQVRTSGDAINLGTQNSMAVTLFSNSSIDSTNNGANPGGATITTYGTINDGVSSYTLDFNAGTAGSLYTKSPGVAGLITISALKVTNTAPNSAVFAGNVQVDDFITTANPYSVTFTGANNTFANGVVFNNTGALTLGNGGDGFAFASGVTATAPSSVTVNGNVSATGKATITLGDADTPLSIAGISTIGGASTGAISLGTATLANGATLTVGAGAATPITLAAVSGTAGAGNSSDLAFNTTAAVNVTGAVTTNIGTVTITNSGGITFADNVQIGTLVTTANPYAVTLTGSNNSFSQAVNLLNTGLVTLGDAAGTDLFLFNDGLTFAGGASSKIGAVIRSSADAINFGAGGVTLLATSTVDSTNNGGSAAGGAVTFGATVNGTVGGAAEALTVTGGVGNVTFSGAVGGSDPLGAIIINTGGQTLFDSSVKALSLFTDQPGTAILNGDVTTTGAAGVQINEWTIDIKSGLTISTVTGNGTVVLGGVGGAMNSVGAAKDLTISSGTGNVTLNSTIGGTSPLGALAINTSGATTFNAPVTATSVITDTPGTAILNGNITASGAAGVQIQELTIGLYSPVTITSAAGPVSLGGAGGTINSEAGETNNLTITAGNAKDVTLNSAIGGTERLGDIVVNTSGATLFNAAVTAKSISTDQPGTAALNGDIDVNGTVGLLIRELTIGINNPITINSSNGPVTLSSAGGAINSQTGETNNLTITAGNAKDVTLNAAIGGTERLGDIVVNTSGATLFNAAVTAKSISTDQPGTASLNGNINVNGANGVRIRELTIDLNDHITINSTLGPVILSSTGGAINSQTGETNDLIINAGPNQDVTLNASVGGIQALRDIKVFTDGLTALNASITAASLFTDAPGTATLGNNAGPMVIALSGAAGAQINELLGVILNGPVTINATNAPVTFAGPLDSKVGTSHNFTVNAGTGAITFNGPVGGTTKPNNLDLTGGNININATTQAMNVRMIGGNLNWDADIISPGFGTPGVAYGYHTFVGTINLLRNVTIEGNVGTVNGTREYTTPRVVGAFTLTPRYNPEPVVPTPPAQDPPNLLNNQLNMNQMAASVPADGAPPSGSGGVAAGGGTLRARSLDPDADDKRRISKAAADGKVCLMQGVGLCVSPSREQNAARPPSDPPTPSSTSTASPASLPFTQLPAPLPPLSQAQ